MPTSESALTWKYLPVKKGKRFSIDSKAVYIDDNAAADKNQNKSPKRISTKIAKNHVQYNKNLSLFNRLIGNDEGYGEVQLKRERKLSHLKPECYENDFYEPKKCKTRSSAIPNIDCYQTYQLPDSETDVDSNMNSNNLDDLKTYMNQASYYTDPDRNEAKIPKTPFYAEQSPSFEDFQPRVQVKSSRKASKLIPSSQFQRKTSVLKGATLLDLGNGKKTSILLLPDSDGEQLVGNLAEELDDTPQQFERKIGTPHILNGKSKSILIKKGRVSFQQKPYGNDSAYEPLDEAAVDDSLKINDESRDGFELKSTPNDISEEITAPPTQENLRRSSIAKALRGDIGTDDVNLQTKNVDFDESLDISKPEVSRKSNKQCGLKFQSRIKSQKFLDNETPEFEDTTSKSTNSKGIIRYKIENTDLSDIFKAVCQKSNSLDYHLAYNFLVDNFFVLATHADFDQLPPDTFVAIISEPRLRVLDEEKFYLVLLKWLNFGSDRSLRKYLTPEVMSHVRFHELTKKDFLIRCFDDLKDWETCKEWIRKAHWYRDCRERGISDSGLDEFFPPDRSVPKTLKAATNNSALSHFLNLSNQSNTFTNFGLPTQPCSYNVGLNGSNGSYFPIGHTRFNSSPAYTLPWANQFSNFQSALPSPLNYNLPLRVINATPPFGSNNSNMARPVQPYILSNTKGQMTYHPMILNNTTPMNPNYSLTNKYIRKI